MPDYKYINQLQSYAIQNPQWFWGDSKEASDARQYLYNNNAGAVVDEIYDNTPQSIQKTISPKKLSTTKKQQLLNTSITDATENFATKALTTAGLTALVVPALASAPVTTVAGLAAGAAGSVASNAVSSALTGQSLDYHMGRGVNRVADLFNRNGNTAYAPREVVRSTSPNKEKYESLGAWINPVALLAGGAGAYGGNKLSSLIKLPKDPKLIKVTGNNFYKIFEKPKVDCHNSQILDYLDKNFGDGTQLRFYNRDKIHEVLDILQQAFPDKGLSAENLDRSLFYQYYRGAPANINSTLAAMSEIYQAALPPKYISVPKSVRSFYKYDVLPRLKRSGNNDPEFESLINGLDKKPIEVGWTPWGITGWHKKANSDVRLSFSGSPKQSITTLAHELHHYTRQHPGYSMEDQGIVPNLPEYRMIANTPIQEIGATSAEVRYPIWKSLRRSNHKIPSIEEVDNKIDNLDMTDLWKNQNSYGKRLFNIEFVKGKSTDEINKMMQNITKKIAAISIPTTIVTNNELQN